MISGRYGVNFRRLWWGQTRRRNTIPAAQILRATSIVSKLHKLKHKTERKFQPSKWRFIVIYSMTGKQAFYVAGDYLVQKRKFLHPLPFEN
jgi:hypothetical protein